jgi:hypothetical protein
MFRWFLEEEHFLREVTSPQESRQNIHTFLKMLPDEKAFLLQQNCKRKASFVTAYYR